MSSYDRPIHRRVRERERFDPRRSFREPRWEDDERFYRRDPDFGDDYERAAGERESFDPRGDFPRPLRGDDREERDFGGFAERDPGAWRRAARFDEPRGRLHSEGGWERRGFERFEDWQQPRRMSSGGGVYGGTPERDAELRGHAGGYRRGGRGLYAGRGPKDFRRSDERLREEVCEALMADPDVDASDVTVSVSDGEVTLEGHVQDRQMKRDAEDCAEDVLGVRQVHNRLRVESGRGDDLAGRGAYETGQRGLQGTFEDAGGSRGQQAGATEGQRAGRSSGRSV